MAFFVSLEGGEGSGKTTQAEILRHRLACAGYEVIAVREPGTTPLGNYVRRWLKGDLGGDDGLCVGAELLLFAAARADLVAKVIRPAMSRPNTVVLADRYADSSTAYQGYGRGIRLDLVQAANALATGGVMPNLTFLLDCPPREGLKRIGALQLRLPLDPMETAAPRRREHEGVRFEDESLDFHQAVRAGYLTLAEEEPARWEVVDATGSVEEVSECIWGRVKRALGSDVPGGGTLVPNDGARRRPSRRKPARPVAQSQAAMPLQPPPDD